MAKQTVSIVLIDSLYNLSDSGGWTKLSLGVYWGETEDAGNCWPADS